MKPKILRVLTNDKKKKKKFLNLMYIGVGEFFHKQGNDFLIVSCFEPMGFLSLRLLHQHNPFGRRGLHRHRRDSIPISVKESSREWSWKDPKLTQKRRRRGLKERRISHGDSGYSGSGFRLAGKGFSLEWECRKMPSTLALITRLAIRDMSKYKRS